MQTNKRPLAWATCSWVWAQDNTPCPNLPPPRNPGPLLSGPRCSSGCLCTIRDPPSQPVSRAARASGRQATAGVAAPLSSKARVAIAALGTGPFRGVEPVRGAATNQSAAFSAGDPNFAARSLALKKKWRKKKEAQKGSGTREPGAKESVQPRPPPSPVRAHRLSA